VIVELKQWENVEAKPMDGVVPSVVGGGPGERTHPAYQVWSYSCLLVDFNTAVQENSIEISSYAYLHSCCDGSGVLLPTKATTWIGNRCFSDLMPMP